MCVTVHNQTHYLASLYEDDGPTDTMQIGGQLMCERIYATKLHLS